MTRWLLHLLSLSALAFVAAITASSCSDANAVDRVSVRIIGTQFRVTWYFHAIGTVPKILATAGFNDSSQKGVSDTLPGTATVDSATWVLPPAGVTETGFACAKGLTEVNNSCKPWSVTGPGSVVSDSAIVKLVLWQNKKTVIATIPGVPPADSNRIQFCSYAVTGDGVYHPVSNNIGIHLCDSVLKTWPQWSLSGPVGGSHLIVALRNLMATASVNVVAPNAHRMSVAAR